MIGGIALRISRRGIRKDPRNPVDRLNHPRAKVPHRRLLFAASRRLVELGEAAASLPEAGVPRIPLINGFGTV